jgi:hypothetical protein
MHHCHWFHQRMLQKDQMYLSAKIIHTQN